MFDRLAALHAIRQYPWIRISCPICGEREGPILLPRDRYLLQVDIRSCAGCDLVYTGRNLSGPSVEQFYAKQYRFIYEDITEVTPEYVYKGCDKLRAAYRYLAISRVVGPITGVVEIGSGLGYFICQCLDAGIENCTGFELGRVFSDYAKKTLNLGEHIRNSNCLSDQAPIPAANVYALFHVLEHLEHPLEILSWIHQRIDDGWLVIEVPDISDGWQRMGLVNFHFGHRFYFSINTLANLLKKCGFGIVKFESLKDDGIYPGNLRVFATSLSRPNTPFIPIPSPDSASIRANITALSRSPLKSDVLYCAARLLKP